jgi:hypothetical protein
MDTVTYPQPRVIEFIEKHMVALRVPPENTQLCSRFNITWTPTLVTLDDEGGEHHRTVGFLPPEELVPSLLLGIAKSHFELEHFTEALQHLGQLVDEYPHSKAVPEAIFFKGVCRYKDTQNPAPLKEAFEQLTAVCPDSEWTQRATPYRLL